MTRSKKSKTKYSPEVKISVIMDMRKNYLVYLETVRKYWNTQSLSEEDLYVKTVNSWERIYLTRAEGFMVELKPK